MSYETVTAFRCDICHTIFTSKTEVKDCSNAHLQGALKPEYNAGDRYPKNILFIGDNGTVTEYALATFHGSREDDK